MARSVLLPCVKMRALEVGFNLSQMVIGVATHSVSMGSGYTLTVSLY